MNHLIFVFCQKTYIGQFCDYSGSSQDNILQTKPSFIISFVVNVDVFAF